MNKTLISMLVCPVCKGKLELKSNELICYVDKLAFSMENNGSIININPEQARLLTAHEINDRDNKKI
ncbi:MAG: hypothetical protein RLZZ210_1611 [Pseudomonadota bacterium]|jgi:uncharacterized protein YbaR (Trm112 family)